MFGETWKWAGNFRQRNYNLGVDWHMVPEQMKLLEGDIAHWQKSRGGIGFFQQSVRIHARLVKIHPFVNGNGRHARLVSDIYLFNLDQELPVWPGKALIEASDVREKYIFALQAADKGNFALLENFTANLCR